MRIKCLFTKDQIFHCEAAIICDRSISFDYQNDWDGGGLSDGTYYYVLKCKGLKEEVQYEGVVMILTKSR